ncbi:MAG: alpha/beta hydrolase [Chthoniobacterales bacterium]|nr:alpha/beta hydrolase [Chthoniobacterales bacterium]
MRFLTHLSPTIIPNVLFVSVLKLLVVLLCAGLLLSVVSVLMMSRMLLRPRRMTDVRALLRLNRMSPEDLGLPFEPMTFRVRDTREGSELNLASWWIPRPAAAQRGRCVVVLHGYGDAKVGGIAWAPMFHERGWNVLAMDLRAHGESGGHNTTAGFYERHDLQQSLADLRARLPNETQSIVLFGVSLGAAVALATTELCERDGQNIAGVICDSPFADYYQAVATHGEILGFPGGIFRHLGMKLTEATTGARFADVRPADLIGRVHAPLMLIIADDDPFVPARDAALLDEAVRQRPPDRITSVWHIPGCPHIFGLAFATDDYREQVGRFLDAAGATREEIHREVVEIATKTLTTHPHPSSADR